VDTQTGVTVAGDISIDGLVGGKARVAGAFTPPVPKAPKGFTPLGYSLTVAVDATILGTTAATTVTLGNATGLDISVSFDSAAIDFSFAGSVSTTGRYCVSGDVTLSLPGPNAAGAISFCNKGTGAGFKVSADVLGYHVGPVAITVPTFSIGADFGPYEGEAKVCLLAGCVGIDGSFEVEVAVSTTSGFDVDGSGTAAAFTEVMVPGVGWRRVDLARASLSVDTSAPSACAVVRAFGQDVELCF
jgi:hypothetical protein